MWQITLIVWSIILSTITIIILYSLSMMRKTFGVSYNQYTDVFFDKSTPEGKTGADNALISFYLLFNTILLTLMTMIAISNKISPNCY